MNQELFYKSEGVRDCVKWLEKKIKEDRKYYKEFYGSSDDFYYLKTRVDSLIEVKISLEKYMKKLKHKANEEE